ncbi:resuscitation-promoting factor Rpf1 domain-containing protein [Corynebacterium pseudodiphtheriticum]|uniref:resuscitation-promoting factor Rpf1 domain-containing protein n=1 Tax=Corynebacterium pseudodiphtheriticum TaxID=37637 RepID=UPI003B59FE24
MGRHSNIKNKRMTKLAAATAAVGASAALFSPAANAAPISDWDRLAECEANGNWSINTGNGFSGGLQFTNSTWHAFGGGQFAPAAHQATKSQQIWVAERTLAGQGWGAWPACSAKLGLNSAPNLDRAPNGAAAAPAPAPAQPAQYAGQRAAAAPTGGNEFQAIDDLYQRIEAALANYGLAIPAPIADAYQHALAQAKGAIAGAPSLESFYQANAGAIDSILNLR